MGIVKGAFFLFIALCWSVFNKYDDKRSIAAFFGSCYDGIIAENEIPIDCGASEIQNVVYMLAYLYQ